MLMQFKDEFSLPSNLNFVNLYAWKVMNNKYYHRISQEKNDNAITA